MTIFCQWMLVVPVLQGSLFQIQNADAQGQQHHDLKFNSSIMYDSSENAFVSQSSNNDVYQNNVSNCETGIDVYHNAAENTIYNNTITNSEVGLGIEEAESGNKIHSNTIIDASEVPVNIVDSDSNEGDILKKNKIINTI